MLTCFVIIKTRFPWKSAWHLQEETSNDFKLCSFFFFGGGGPKTHLLWPEDVFSYYLKLVSHESPHDIYKKKSQLIPNFVIIFGVREGSKDTQLTVTWICGLLLLKTRFLMTSPHGMYTTAQSPFCYVIFSTFFLTYVLFINWLRLFNTVLVHINLCSNPLRTRPTYGPVSDYFKILYWSIIYE